VTATLAGRRIVVTRRPGQSTALVAGLRDRGAEVLEVPAIEIAPPDDPAPLDAALRGLERYQWIAFTSGNAARAVADRLAAIGLPPSLAARGPRIASIGPSTTDALRAGFPGDPVSLEPAGEFRAAGLVRAFSREPVKGARVLLPVSSLARDELARGLLDLGAVVDSIPAYRTVEPHGLRAAVARCLAGKPDAVTFASPSAVTGFASAAGAEALGLPAVVIGPTTEAAARAAGLDVRAVAEPSTTEGLLAALEALFRA
jgi:uroporphyrinogen-III synthase